MRQSTENMRSHDASTLDMHLITVEHRIVQSCIQLNMTGVNMVISLLERIIRIIRVEGIMGIQQLFYKPHMKEKKKPHWIPEKKKTEWKEI